MKFDLLREFWLTGQEKKEVFSLYVYANVCVYIYDQNLLKKPCMDFNVVFTLKFSAYLCYNSREVSEGSPICPVINVRITDYKTFKYSIN